jgi:dihydroflavonol-4-reductase
MEIAGKVVAVTGANGFLGAYIVRALHRSGAKVRAIVRDPAKAAFLGSMVDDVKRAELGDKAALVEALRGADAVVSNAGLWTIKPTAKRLFDEVNIDGVANLMAAVSEASVKRVVHISTFGVYKLGLGGAVDEEHAQVKGTPFDGPYGAYRASKAKGEELVFKAASTHGLDVTVLRPAGMYGARETHIMPWIKRLTRLPVMVAPPIVWPFSYAGDIANAVVASLLRDVAIGKAYNVCGEPKPVGDLLKAMRVVDPESKAIIIGVPGKVGITADVEDARRDLDFKNRPFTEGLRQTLEEDRRGLDV